MSDQALPTWRGWLGALIVASTVGYGGLGARALAVPLLGAVSGVEYTAALVLALGLLGAAGYSSVYAHARERETPPPRPYQAARNATWLADALTSAAALVCLGLALAAGGVVRFVDVGGAAAALVPFLLVITLAAGFSYAGDVPSPDPWLTRSGAHTDTRRARDCRRRRLAPTTPRRSAKHRCAAVLSTRRRRERRPEHWRVRCAHARGASVAERQVRR